MGRMNLPSIELVWKACLACNQPFKPNGHSTCDKCVDWNSNECGLQTKAAQAWGDASGLRFKRPMSEIDERFDDAVHAWLKLWSLEEFFRLSPGGDKSSWLLKDQHENLQLIAKRMCPVLRRHSQHEAHRRLGAKPVPEADPW